jgi:hypothetical protein
MVRSFIRIWLANKSTFNFIGEASLSDKMMIDPSEALASSPSRQLEPGSNGNTSLSPPPEFTHYKPTYFIGRYSDVVSYDPCLNSDDSFFSIE